MAELIRDVARGVYRGELREVAREDGSVEIWLWNYLLAVYTGQDVHEYYSAYEDIKEESAK